MIIYRYNKEIVKAVILPILSIIQPSLVFQIGKTELKLLWQRGKAEETLISVIANQLRLCGIVYFE